MNTVPHGIEASYRATVRKFPQSIEITVKPVNHTLELARSRNCGIKGIGYQAELDEEERQRKDEENQIRAIRRAKQSVRWMINRIEADHLVTLTYRDNMQDVNQLKHDFDLFRRLVKARYPDWHYVATRERQERGALHLHLAVKGHQDIKYLRKCWYKVLGCVGAVGMDVLGQVDVQAPKKRFNRSSGSCWKTNKLSWYLTKYIDKEFDELEHASKRYWGSKGTPKPEIHRHWLGSTDITSMIKDAYELAELHGMVLFSESAMQSQDRSILFLSGVIDGRCSVSLEHEFDD